MKKVLIIVGIVLVVGGIFGFFMAATDGLNEGLNVPLDGIDLSEIADGVYEGTYEHKRWTNTVRVYVTDHAITNIEIVSDVAGAGVTNASDEIFSRVVAAQNTDVDAVSGATVTSKAYLKAIEDALKNQIR